MKFLIDAQLPRRMANWFIEAEHDAIHTLDLPGRNRTTDAVLMALADAEGRVLATKDADFVNAHLLTGSPHRLLLVSVGNITNRSLAGLFLPLLERLTEAFSESDFVEMARSGSIILRGPLRD